MIHDLIFLDSCAPLSNFNFQTFHRDKADLNFNFLFLNYGKKKYTILNEYKKEQIEHIKSNYEFLPVPV
jgi:hypothetical protein